MSDSSQTRPVLNQSWPWRRAAKLAFMALLIVAVPLSFTLAPKVLLVHYFVMMPAVFLGIRLVRAGAEIISRAVQHKNAKLFAIRLPAYALQFILLLIIYRVVGNCGITIQESHSSGYRLSVAVMSGLFFVGLILGGIVGLMRYLIPPFPAFQVRFMDLADGTRFTFPIYGPVNVLVKQSSSTYCHDGANYDIAVDPTHPVQEFLGTSFILAQRRTVNV